MCLTYSTSKSGPKFAPLQHPAPLDRFSFLNKEKRQKEGAVRNFPWTSNPGILQSIRDSAAETSCPLSDRPHSNTNRDHRKLISRQDEPRGQDYAAKHMLRGVNLQLAMGVKKYMQES